MFTRLTRLVEAAEACAAGMLALQSAVREASSKGEDPQLVERMAELEVREGSAHDGFVAIDPEGYFLEFEWFNPHPENALLTPLLEAIEPIRTNVGARPPELAVHATVLWLYYDDVEPIQRFYERLLGVDLLVDQGWAKVYEASSTGYIGLVDASRGLHAATEETGVTVSFFTDDVDAWLERARAQGVELRTDQIVMESERVRVFVGYDPDGYFLEWDTFLDREGNERLLEQMR
jgi:predicted enzyme related to lactoylglutathione lyase